MAREVTRRRFISAAAAASVLGAPLIIRAATDDSWGDLVGRLEYDGDAPAREKLTVDKDVDCCGKFDIRDESLMVGEERGLTNAFVYVRSRRVEVSPQLAESVEPRVLLDNKDCIFKPHCMGLWIEKQEYHIVNSDPVAQNVAFSPLGDVPANIVLPVDADATWKFRRAQMVPTRVVCNYHPWERAYVLPRDNPYVAITAPDGTFRIPGLPVGELEFQVWHERLGYLDVPRWPKGRFSYAVKPGVNDLGTVKLNPSLFEK